MACLVTAANPRMPHVRMLNARMHARAQVVDVLLAGGANPDVSEDQHVGTPLMVACSMGCTRVVASLVRSGADLDIVCPNPGW